MNPTVSVLPEESLTWCRTDGPIVEDSIVSLRLSALTTGRYHVLAEGYSDPVVSGFCSSATDELRVLLPPTSSVAVSFVEAPSTYVVEVNPAAPAMTTGTVQLSTMPSAAEPLSVRQASALMRASRFAGADIAPPPALEVDNDAVTIDPGVAVVGSGWYPNEIDDGFPLRWLAHAGEILVSRPEAATSVDLILHAQPGPALDPVSALLLLKTDSGRVLGARSATFNGAYRFTLPASAFTGHVTTFHLEIENPHPPMYAGDERTLALRVNHIEIAEHINSIDSIDFVAGWESDSGNPNSLQWVTERARLEVSNSGSSPDLAVLLHAEPGPCLDPINASVALLRPDGSIIDSQPVRSAGPLMFRLGRGQLELGRSHLELRVTNPNPQTYAHDDRQLNLRVQSILLLSSGDAIREIHRHQRSFPTDLPVTGHATGGFNLGIGWNAPETEGTETFRWSGGDAEFSFTNRENARLQLHLRAGPDLDDLQPLVVKNSDGEVVVQRHWTQTDLHIELDGSDDGPFRISSQPTVVSDSDRADQRILAFRLMSVSAELTQQEQPSTPTRKRRLRSIFR